MPKPNMYQSLHTTVLDKRAIPFEVQIRTWEMHYTADQLEAEDVTDIAKNIRNDFEENDVYVFTPKGDVMVIPNGSTPIDLAYIIHTQVGHRMVGA